MKKIFVKIMNATKEVQAFTITKRVLRSLSSVLMKKSMLLF